MMEQLKKTSMRLYKYCPRCHETKSVTIFYRSRSRGDGLSGLCKICVRATSRIYDQSEHGRKVNAQRFKRYRLSEKGQIERKLTEKRYKQTEKFKQTRKKWEQTIKGKEYKQRYQNSPKGIMSRYRCEASKKRMAYKREYLFNLIKNGEWYEYKRRKYHEIQEAAGCHMSVVDFYPGYRIIKALENAEVIEI